MIIGNQIRSIVGLIAVGVSIPLQAVFAEPEKKDFTPEFVTKCKERAEAGDAEGQALYGRALANGWGVASNHVAAVEWLRKAAEQGNALCQAKLGVCYFSGIGVEKDMAKAMKWFHKAAEQGLADAQCLLGAYYLGGIGVEKDKTKAAEWYRKAAEQGDARGQRSFGVCYELGIGVEKDEAKAAEWYRKAAEQGDARGQRSFGECYELGKGVEKDEAKAVEWYRKAAEQGDADGQCYLGECYELGKGVEKDEAKAAEWYRKAAIQGFARAQYRLGLCYEYGGGVEIARPEAVKWYRRAAEQGYANAQETLARIEEFGEKDTPQLSTINSNVDEEDVYFCGFYLGMSAKDAEALITQYELIYGEYTINGNLSTKAIAPSDLVYSFWFSLRSVRKILGGGNSFEELSHAVEKKLGCRRIVENTAGEVLYHAYGGRNGVELELHPESWYEPGFYPRTNWLMAGLKIHSPMRRLRFDQTLAERKRKADEQVAKKRMESNKAELDHPAKVAISKLKSDMIPIPGQKFAICRFEVTQALWFAVMGSNPSMYLGAARPVENISWDDIQVFLQKLNAIPEVKETGIRYRLPTSDEWVFACLAGATGDYCKLKDGTEITTKTLDKVAWFVDLDAWTKKAREDIDEANRIWFEQYTRNVGMKMPNAFGLYDMLGNVAELTASIGLNNDDRTICGGSWRDDANDNTAFQKESLWHKSPLSIADISRGGFRLAADKVGQ